MFWEEAVRFCKDCKHYVNKDWSVLNYECKLGNKTPSAGDTPACKSYVKQSTLFMPDYHCKDCARWKDGFLSGKCIKGYPSPKGKDSDVCKYFVNG